MRASFQLSYQALDAENARLFRLLGLLPGLDFHPWVATALLNVDLYVAEDLLDGLVVAQLVEPASESGRFRLHDLLRLFAREHLGREPDLDQVAAVNRLLEIAIASVHTARVAMGPSRRRREQDEGRQVDPRVALAWLEAERGTLVTLIELATERGLWPAAWNLSELLSEFLSRRGYRADLERVHRLAVQAARQAGHREAEARALSNLGLVLGHQGHWEQAVEHQQQALTIWGQTRNRHGEAQTLTNLGQTLAHQGHWQSAVDHHRQALAVLREVGDRHGQAQTLNSLGNVLVLQGHWQEATDHYQQSLAIKRELGDRPGKAQALINLGNLLARQGHWPPATESYGHALTVLRELGDRHGQAQAEYNLGLALAKHGQAQHSAEHWRAALAIFEQLNAPEVEQVRAALQQPDRRRPRRRRSTGRQNG